MNRIPLIACLAAGLTLAACNNQPDEENGSADDPEAAETETAEVTPRTDSEGNEIVSEGPDEDARPYDAGAAAEATDSPEGGDDATRSAAPPTQSAAQRPASPPPAARSSQPSKPASKSVAGSKLQKADPPQ